MECGDSSPQNSESGDESPHSTLGGLNDDHIFRWTTAYRILVELLTRRIKGRYKVLTEIFIFPYIFNIRASRSDKYFKSFATNTGIFLYDFFDKFNKVIGTPIPA